MHTFVSMYLNRHTLKNKWQTKGEDRRGLTHSLWFETQTTQESKKDHSGSGFTGTFPVQGQLAIPRPAGRKCEPKDIKSLTVGMVYNGHRVLLWALLLLESSAQVIQGIIQWAGITTSLLPFLPLSHLPTMKSILSFSETSGLFLEEEAPPSHRLHFSHCSSRQMFMASS